MPEWEPIHLMYFEDDPPTPAERFRADQRDLPELVRESRARQDEKLAALGEPIVHRHPKCGGVAARLAPGVRPKATDWMSMSHFTHADGLPFRGYDVLRCDACNRAIGFQPNFAGGPWEAIS